MKLKTIKTVDAIGKVLSHDITKIVPGEFKGRLYKKGHIITKEDVEKLLAVGKDILYVYEETPGYIHENDAAYRLKEILTGDNINTTEVSEGKINLIANVDGVLKIDTDKLCRLNMIDQVICATKPNLSFVKKNTIIAGTRVIPLIIDETRIEEAEKIGKKIINVLPIKRKKIAIITTGNEVFYGRIEDKFQELLLSKLNDFDIEYLGQKICPDDEEVVTKSINDFIGNGAEVIICTGGMSVDASDITPKAIENVAKPVSYGMPVLAGSMTMVAYGDGYTVLGLPAGMLFTEKSTFDVLIHRVLADDVITREEIALYGNGGLL